MNVERITKGQIISTVEQYNALCSRLRRDRLDYENYKILEPDEEKAKIAFQKVAVDFEDIGNFLDEYI